MSSFREQFDELRRMARGEDTTAGAIRQTYVAIGADELAEPLGDTIVCEWCGKVHRVEYGRKDGTPDKDVAYARCRGKTYLCGVGGKRWRASDEPRQSHTRVGIHAPDVAREG